MKKLTLSKLLSSIDPENLYHTSMRNFYQEHGERFEIIQGKPPKKDIGTMCWCDSYLDAVMLLLLKSGSCILWDMASVDDNSRNKRNPKEGSYCVILPIKFKQT